MYIQERTVLLWALVIVIAMPDESNINIIQRACLFTSFAMGGAANMHIYGCYCINSYFSTYSLQ